MSFLTMGLMASVLLFNSCEKENKPHKTYKIQHGSEVVQANYYSSMSLDEFISSVHSNEEVYFFEHNSPMDYSNEYTEMLSSFSSENEIEETRFRIVFKWGGDGCTIPLGICFIFSYSPDLDMNASAFFYNGKLIIIPDSEDNGLTRDLYLPIFSDVRVDDTNFIRHGIYKAYYNENTGVKAIVVDIYDTSND